MKLSRINRRGQLYLPTVIRRSLGIISGDLIAVEPVTIDGLQFIILVVPLEQPDRLLRDRSVQAPFGGDDGDERARQ